MWCGLCGFFIIKPQTALHHVVWCGAVRCGAILLAVRCGYAILRAVLVRFLQFVWFMRFGEHPCSLLESLHSLKGKQL